MKTFLVTGGAGFIGSHLCQALLRDQHRVRVLDNLSTGRQANLPREVDFLHGDINDPAVVARALDGVAGCFHLAAIASVERGVRDWQGTHRVNLTGTIVLLDAIRRLRGTSGAIPFVYASSAAVYGDNADLPLVEAAEKRPLSAYGADKYACELHASVAARVHGIPTVGLRFFNVYGPRQDPCSPYSGVISVFADRMLRGERVHIYGDGEQTRDFIYVEDVVAALVAAMQGAAATPAVFNVCTGVPVSVLALMQTIAELTGRSADPCFEPARSGEIRNSVGSPERMREVLRLGEPTSLRAGLGHVLTWLAQAGQHD